MPDPIEVADMLKGVTLEGEEVRKRLKQADPEEQYRQTFRFKPGQKVRDKVTGKGGEVVDVKRIHHQV